MFKMKFSYKYLIAEQYKVLAVLKHDWISVELYATQ